MLSAVTATAAATAAVNGAGAGKRVAVLGAGAAGLVASRLLREAGFGVRCFERTGDVGGVWRYRPEDVMYRSLVTNLPKEIMAYLDTPFDASLPVSRVVRMCMGLRPAESCAAVFHYSVSSSNAPARPRPKSTHPTTPQSFLGHAQVQAYLEAYAQRHHLTGLVSFHTEVRAVRPLGLLEGDYSAWWEEEEEEWSEDELQQPRWRVSYATTRRRQGQGSEEAEEEEEEFDAVVVANGHFDIPYTPEFPGLRECYKGRVLHSRNYDCPSVCAGLRVLCVGYKSSGTDIARYE